MRNAHITEAEERRPLEQIERAVLEYLAEVNKEIENSLNDTQLYENHSDYYSALYGLSQRRGGVELYADERLRVFQRRLN